VKLRNFFELLGLKRKPEHHTYAVEKCDVGNGITINYAKWLHKRTRNAALITASQVDDYREILNEGDFCVDIGAHMGDSTLPMAVAVGTSGCVLALEPNPYVYHVLEKNARSNRHAINMVTMMAAVAPEKGFLQFEYSDPGFCNGGRHEGIPSFVHAHAYKLNAFCVNLEQELYDDFSDRIDRLKFIKVDTEGFDLYVLKSLATILKRYQPRIKAEMFKQTSIEYRTETLSFLEGLGYEVFKMKREPIEAGERLTLDNVGKPGDHYDILCVPG